MTAPMEFYMPLFDEHGQITGTRPATDEEIERIAPGEMRQRRIEAALEALILDRLTGDE